MEHDRSPVPHSHESGARARTNPQLFSCGAAAWKDFRRPDRFHPRLTTGIGFFPRNSLLSARSLVGIVLRTSRMRGLRGMAHRVPAEFSTMRYYLFRLSPVNSLEDTIIDAARHQPLPPGKVIVFTAVSHVRCPFGVRPSRTHGSRRLRDCSPQRSE